MAGNGTNTDEIGATQRRVIAALLTERSVVDAATKTKVAKRTIFRWLSQDSEFVAALRQAEAVLLDEATRRLLSMQTGALDALECLLFSEDESVRLRTATTILSHTLRLKETRDFADRIAELEKLANGQTDD